MIVLLPNCGFLSETSRMLALAQALRARGEEVLLATRGGPYAAVLDQSGLDVVRLEPGSDDADARRFLDAVLSMGLTDEPFYPPGVLRAAVDAEVELFARTGAQIAVTGFTLSAYLSTRVAGIPLATSHGGSFVLPVLERGLAPVPVNPPRPEIGRLPRWVQRRMANLVPRLLTGCVAQLNEAADELGIEHVPNLAALMCGDLTLVTEAPELLGIPQADLDAWRPRWPTRARTGTSFRCTGPLFARLDLPVPERVDAFLAANPGTVYLSPTSVHEPFLRDLVRCVQDAGAPVLVSATVHDVSDLEDERTLVAATLPNHLVMPRVAATVVMGGQGSVQSSLAAGTPLVGLPYHGEQELNVAVAARQGAAVAVSPRDVPGPALTTAVRRVLSDPAYAAAASRVRDLYSRTDGAAAAADAILRHLGRPGSEGRVAVDAERPTLSE